MVKLAVDGLASAQKELKLTLTCEVTNALLLSTILTETLVVSPTLILLEPKVRLPFEKPAPEPVPICNGVISKAAKAIGSLLLTVSSVAVILSPVGQPRSL